MIFLPHVFAAGPIPTTIGAVAGLEDLKVHNNQLTGTRVRFYAQCHGGQANVTLLVDVGSGCIPSEIGRATRLYNLNLQGNALTGSCLAPQSWQVGVQYKVFTGAPSISQVGFRPS